MNAQPIPTASRLPSRANRGCSTESAKGCAVRWTGWAETGNAAWGYSIRLWLQQAIAATQPLGLESEGACAIGLRFVVNAEDYLD
jgi:hypothetical protein